MNTPTFAEEARTIVGRHARPIWQDDHVKTLEALSALHNRLVQAAVQDIVDEGFRLYKLQFTDETMPDRTWTQAESQVLHRTLAQLTATTGEGA